MLSRFVEARRNAAAGIRRRVASILPLVIGLIATSCQDEPAGVPVRYLRVAQSSITLQQLDSARIRAVLLNSRGDEVADPPITFVSSDADRVEVNSKGLVKSLGEPGSVRILISAGTRRDTVEVTVFRVLDRMELQDSSLTIVERTTRELRGRLIDRNGDPFPLPVEIRSASTGVADVDPTTPPSCASLETGDFCFGIRGNATGTAQLTVVAGQLRDTVAVTVFRDSAIVNRRFGWWGNMIGENSDTIVTATYYWNVPEMAFHTYVPPNTLTTTFQPALTKSLSSFVIASDGSGMYAASSLRTDPTDANEKGVVDFVTGGTVTGHWESAGILGCVCDMTLAPDGSATVIMHTGDATPSIKELAPTTAAERAGIDLRTPQAVATSDSAVYVLTSETNSAGAPVLFLNTVNWPAYTLASRVEIPDFVSSVGWLNYVVDLELTRDASKAFVSSFEALPGRPGMEREKGFVDMIDRASGTVTRAEFPGLIADLQVDRTDRFLFLTFRAEGKVRIVRLPDLAVVAEVITAGRPEWVRQVDDSLIAVGNLDGWIDLIAIP